MVPQGKTAVITGATGVIGGAIARFFSRAGYSLLLSGRSKDALLLLQKELAQTGNTIEIFSADVATLSDVQTLFAFAAETFGSLDTLVTAAGTYGDIGALEQCDPEAWTEAIRVNLFGTVWCVQHALPLLKKSGHGKVIAFAGGGEGALPRFTPYASSKAAVLRFVESMAQELAPYHIDINAISPGLVTSGLSHDLIAAGPERAGKEKYDAAVQEVAGEGSAVSPDRAAELAVFLASDASNGLSGKNISAMWDTWRDIPKHLSEIMQSDIYNYRRVKPKDRGYDWK